MSAPVPPEHRDNGRWETIKYAIDSNARTIRLCVIGLVLAVAPVAAGAVVLLMRHVI